MSAKFITSLAEENQDLKKQIGCMTGIFQLFDRQHFLGGRRMSRNNHNKLIQGANHDTDPKYTKKTTTVREKISKAVPKEISGELYLASDSSSSDSFTRSNKTDQHKAVSSNQSNTKSKEDKTSFPQVVKDSMYREPRSLSIKSKVKDGRKGHVVKHIDSPRPLQNLGGLQDGTKSSKNEKLARPRLSYDERESRDSLKSKITLRELPRLSLDSKASSIKNSALESRCSSNVVAKLMGLEAFPNIISTDESTMTNVKSCLPDENIRISPKAANEGKSKPVSSPRFPLEPAPWKQQDANKGSEKRASKSSKASKDVSNVPSSVYGEIEKRITELEFKKSGKDLRALKQILEAMQKTRQRLENQKESSEVASQSSISSLEFSSSSQDSSLLMSKGQQNVRQFTTSKGTIETKRSKSSIMIMKPVKASDKIRISNSTHTRENSVHRKRTKDLVQSEKNLKDPSRVLSSTAEKNNLRGSELPTTPKALGSIKVENFTASRRSLGVVSPRSQWKKHEIDRRSQTCSKQFKEYGYSNRKLKQKTTNLYQGDAASEISESNNSMDSHSHTETEVTSLAHSIEMNDEHHDEAKFRNHEERSIEGMQPRVEHATTTLEQPSPVSVLDATFYGDESPSPVKKKLTTFKGYDCPSPDEEECHLDNLNHLPISTRSTQSYHKIEDIENLSHILSILNTTPDDVATYHNPSLNESSNKDQQYITKILVASGLLRDVHYIPIANQLHSSRHVINPNLFHVLEQMEECKRLTAEGSFDKNTWLNINLKMHRKVVFDTISEILVRKCCSNGLIMSGRKMLNPQRLLKEVQLEFDSLQRKTCCSFDDDDDELDRIITANLMHKSADWTKCIDEVPALVLDVERLIFRDFIDEVILSAIFNI